METIVAALLGPALAALFAWGIGSFITDRWDEAKRRRDLDLRALSEFYQAYGEFLGVWRLWASYKRYGETSGPPADTQWLCLSRASDVESRLEALLIRTTAERTLCAQQQELLACFREAYQRLRECIRRDKELRWFTRTSPTGREYREYQAFKDLSSSIANLLQEDRPKRGLLRRSVTAGVPSASESRRAWTYVTSGREKNRWLERSEELMKSLAPKDQ